MLLPTKISLYFILAPLWPSIGLSLMFVLIYLVEDVSFIDVIIPISVLMVIGISLSVLVYISVVVCNIVTTCKERHEYVRVE